MIGINGGAGGIGDTPWVEINKVDMGTMVHRMDIDNLRRYKL